MSFWTAIVIIVAIMALASVIRSRANARVGYTPNDDVNPVGNPQREAELQEEIAQLHERIRVLERIATDDREAKRLSNEIDQLRDQ